MADTFAIYKTEDNSKVAEGESPLAITGLDPETVVAEGDYQAVRVQDGRESEKVDISAFTVLKAGVPTKISFVVTPKAGGCDFVITPASTATQEGVTGYKCYIKKATEQWSAATMTTVTETTGSYSSLEDGVKYSLGIEAVNATGSSQRVSQTFVAGAPSS
ncbi:hypothetical protein IGI96_000903 [Enterococcus sp. DIV0421]|uniref:Ig-like domain-containing protein n=1 Tax=Enterococcus sp. DIV0421 TaxID=2774688 RepID=UPI003F1E90B2